MLGRPVLLLPLSPPLGLLCQRHIGHRQSGSPVGGQTGGNGPSPLTAGAGVKGGMGMGADLIPPRGEPSIGRQRSHPRGWGGIYGPCVGDGCFLTSPVSEESLLQVVGPPPLRGGGLTTRPLITFRARSTALVLHCNSYLPCSPHLSPLSRRCPLKPTKALSSECSGGFLEAQSPDPA